MSDEAQFLNLPSHLINDILSRLPTRTIVQCKCVCKTWLNLLSESEFINLHLSRSPPCLIVNKQYSDGRDSSCFNLVEFEDEPDHHDFQYVAEFKIKLPENCAEKGLYITMIGSINGLICLHESGYRHDEIYLWNPSTQELITLPTPERVRSRPTFVSYGFGLSPQTGQYKVVRIFQRLEKNSPRILKSNCDVYTLGGKNQGLGVWRRIENASLFYRCCSVGVFLNGNLHWLIAYKDGPELISCFDLEKELFLPFPTPPKLKDFHLVSLGVLGGCLSLCDNTSDYEIVIWVMKEYGITKIWSKEIVIDKEPADLVEPSDEVVQVLKVFKDGDVLLLWKDNILLSYDSRRKILHQSGVHRLFKNLDDQMNEEGYVEESFLGIEAMECVSSFISFKNFGIEITHPKRKKKKKERERKRENFGTEMVESIN